MTQTSKDLVIIGSGGHARELLELALDCAGSSGYRPVAFLSNAKPPGWSGVLPVVTDDSYLRDRFESSGEKTAVLIGIGDPGTRKRLASELEPYAHFPSLVHPSVVMSRNSISLGAGVVVTAGCVLTCDISLGAHVHVNRCSTIGHDCVLGSFSLVNPGAVVSGNVTTGEGASLGAGCTILQKLEIGEWSIVGGGALVNKNVPAHSTVVGVPARVIKQRGGSPSSDSSSVASAKEKAPEGTK